MLVGCLSNGDEWRLHHRVVERLNGYTRTTKGEKESRPVSDQRYPATRACSEDGKQRDSIRSVPDTPGEENAGSVIGDRNLESQCSQGLL